MKKLIYFSFIAIAVGLVFLTSCKEEEPEGPPIAGIFYSIADKQVAFTALTKRVVTWDWDFGDGDNSTEQNPVHIYENGGYYTIKLIGADASGNTAEAEVDVAVAVTPYVLLTGGPTAANGKTWKLTANHTTNDKLVNADANFSLADPDLPSLPQGAFNLYLGMPEVYLDEFTFYFDGRYSHDVKADAAAFGSIVHQLKTTGGAGIVNAGGIAFGLCTALYTPQAGAIFTYVEKEDFAVPSVYGPPTYVVTYKDVSTLDFSGTEFVGFMDNMRKVIIQAISDKSMRLVMFMTGHPDYYPLNTNALILTFEVVQ